MREKYLKMRNANQYDMNWFYDYFKQNGGNATPKEFEIAFNNKKQVIDLGGQKIEHIVPREIKTIIEEMDRVFELTIITDEKGKFKKAL